jgi:hypothetical protein
VEQAAMKVLIALGVVGALLIALVTCHFFLLLKPSAEGKCGGVALDSPDPEPPHISQLRGEVVGKNLWLVQYRWLRRLFKASGTELGLERRLPSTEYKGNVILHSESVGKVVIQKSGMFDFGELTEGEYQLTVRLPGEDSVAFAFVIDSSARNGDVLIDASPGYYCTCCGWNFEPR